MAFVFKSVSFRNISAALGLSLSFVGLIGCGTSEAMKSRPSSGALSSEVSDPDSVLPPETEVTPNEPPVENSPITVDSPVVDTPSNSTEGPMSQEPPVSVTEASCAEPSTSWNPSQFARVLENFDRTSTLSLEGSQWDNTLIRNCRIHDVQGEGIFLRNVKNVVITNCVIYNVSGEGIRTSSTGSTENIKIVGNTISNVGGDGIASPQRILDGVDSKNLLIANNQISETGMAGLDGKYHGIYSQAQGAVITGNRIFGLRDGNGISVRSSGVVSCNRVATTAPLGMVMWSKTLSFVATTSRKMNELSWYIRST